VWVFFKNGIPGYLLFQTPFAFFDSSKSAFLVFGESLAMLLAWAGCGFLVAAGLQKRREKTAAAR